MKHIEIEGIKPLLDFYEELGRAITAARKKTNFYCLEGCGACCYTSSKNLEVTLFEAIPMALALIKNGVHEDFLAQLEEGDCGESTCIMYSKTSEDGQNGFCKQYDARPLICRLFGSSKKISQDGAILPIICKPLKSIHFTNSIKINNLLTALPMSATVSSKARAINPQLSKELFGINDAIRRALYYVLQRMEYENES